MKYKLIAIDVDGTLLNENREIMPETIKAIKYAREKGVQVILSTGRIFMEAKSFSDEAGCNDFGITSSGSAISDFKTLDNIHALSMTCDSSCNALDVLKNHGFECFAYNGKEMILSSIAAGIFKDHGKDEGFNPFRTIREDVSKHIKTENIGLEKIFAMHGNFSNGVLDELNKDNGIFITSSGDQNIEVVPKGANKGEAMKILAKRLNINLDEIIAIGDSDNDYEMIDICGVGVAMANANDKIKSIANFITKSNDEAGVAHAIYNFIK